MKNNWAALSFGIIGASLSSVFTYFLLGWEKNVDPEVFLFLAALSALILTGCIKAARNGRLWNRNGALAKERSPILFWIQIALLALLGLAIPLYGI